jgi:hypothetical protein
VTALREFKARYLAKILSLKKQLLEKYPERADRVNYVVDLLVGKTQNLRVFTLTDYLATLYHASKEFPEVEQLFPSEDEIKELLKEDASGGMRLREFKAKYLARLLGLRKHLLEKYPEKRGRVEYLVETLVVKLEGLRTVTLLDYVFTVYGAAQEFKEFEALIPGESEVEALLSSSAGSAE